jgi:FkbM family methyltransferase
LKKHLPVDFARAPLLVSPDASLRFWKPGIQSDLFDYAREFVHSGSVVWDIGANVGLFAVAAAQRAGVSGQVVAMEADIWLAGLLHRTATMQPSTSAPIQVIPAAAYSSMGVAAFNIARRGRASNFLAAATGSTQTGGIRETVQVVAITLDWLLAQKRAPTVVKIDVEGAEAHVLRGGLRTIAECRPIILCEVCEPACDEVTDLLSHCGYTLYDWDARPHTRVGRACYNTLALPS